MKTDFYCNINIKLKDVIIGLQVFTLDFSTVYEASLYADPMISVYSFLFSFPIHFE